MISSRLRGLRKDDSHVYLRFLPQELTVFEVVQVIVVFITRQILYFFGMGNEFEVRSGSMDDWEIFLLPDLRVSMALQFERDDLTRYATAIRSPESNAENIFGSTGQLCLMLSAFTQPAFLLLLAHCKSPIRPLGSVNVRNRFDLLRPDLCTAEMLLGTKSFVIQARLLRETRKVKRGLEIDIEVELIETNGSEVVFRQIFTMLQFMKFERSISIMKPMMKEDALPADNDMVSFSTEGSATMSWASICKDYNLIHVSDVAAKLFGFPRRIVHGNHAIALALCALQIDNMTQQSTKPEKCSMSVNFIRPVMIPSRMEVSKVTNGSGTAYQLFANAKLSMTGSIITN